MSAVRDHPVFAYTLIAHDVCVCLCVCVCVCVCELRSKREEAGLFGPKQNVPAAPPSPLASSPPSLKLLSPSLFTQSHRFLAVTQQPHPPPPPSPCRRRKDVSVGFVNLRNTAAQPITSSHRCARSYSPVRNAHTHSLARSRFGR